MDFDVVKIGKGKKSQYFFKKKPVKRTMMGRFAMKMHFSHAYFMLIKRDFDFECH